MCLLPRRGSRSLEIGGVEPVKESVRAGRHGALLDDLGRDVRYAFRLFASARSPP